MYREYFHFYSITSLIKFYPIVSADRGGPIWTRSGEQGYQWVLGQVPFATDSVYQRVYFEGVAGDGYQGDIALDDVIIIDGPCPELCEYTSQNLSDIPVLAWCLCNS